MIFRSLRAKLVVPTILLFVLAMGGSTAWTTRVAREAMRRAALDQMENLAATASKSMAAWVGERQRDMVLLGEQDALRAVVAAAAPPPSAVARANELLARCAREGPYYEILVLADRQGRAVCSSDPAAAWSRSVTNRAYFWQAVTGAVVVSDMIVSKTSGNPVFVVAAPVAGDGAPAGVILGSLDLKYFTREFVEPVTIGESGYVYVADRQGLICSHPDASLVMATNLATMPFGREILAQRNGMLFYEYQHEPVVAAFRTDPDFGYIVIARALAREILAPAFLIRNLNAAIGLLAVLLATLLLLLLSRSIAAPVTDLARVAGLIAEGRLADARAAIADTNRRRRPAADETGRLWASVSAMTESLAGLVGQVLRATSQLAATAAQIAAASREQEQVVGEFGASTGEVVAAVQEITATAQELVRTMDSVKTVTENAVRVADAGRGGLAAMDASIGGVVTAAEGVAARLAAIRKTTGAIDGVVTTITKVADQTNLLSLNAAIEAEKAGASGRGFAVVAREIRRLADQTAAATLDIERMVAEMRAAVAAGVADTETFGGAVRRGSQTVGTIGQQLAAVIGQVQALAPRFETVNEGMQAQSQGARQIGRALAQVSQGAERTAESVRQFNAAAEQLRAAARTLQEAVSVFHV